MRKYLIATSVMAIAMTSGHSVWAQDASEQSIARADAEAAANLQTIVVTAQRRQETLQDAAIPINAISGEELASSGVTGAMGLNRVAPALVVNSPGGANAGFFVRGVGNFSNNGYTAPAVAFNLDGVYIGRPSSTIASFLDLNRVEVLKGPQGTLYGRNATGGAINVIPNRPILGEFSGNASAQYGNYDAYQLTGVVNLPIGQSVAARLAATVDKHDGYYSDGTGDADNLALRGQILAELSDDVDVRLSVDYSEQNGIGGGLDTDGIYGFLPGPLGGSSLPVPNRPLIAAPANVAAPFTGLLAPQTLAFIQANASAAPLFSPVTGYERPYRNDKYFGVNAEFNFDLGEVDLVVIPAFRRSELDNQFNGAPFKSGINQDVAKQYSIEGRLSGTVGPVDWILGAYYFDESVEGVNQFNQFSTVTHNSWDSDTESLAFFARGTFNLSDDLRLVGGIRYTDENRSMDAQTTATAGVCRIPAPAGQAQSCPQVPTLPVALTLEEMLVQLDAMGLFPAANPLDAAVLAGAFPYGPLGLTGPQALLVITPTTIDRSAGDNEITYRVAAEYDLSPDNLLYASFETGFRAGGFNITNGREEYDPEFIDAWTIGSKNEFLDNMLQVNFEGFYWKYRGQQLSALGVDAAGNNSFFARNVGRSTILGAEMDFQFLVAETTLLRGGMQYLDATYDSFTYNQVDLSPATAPPNFLTPTVGCPFQQVINGTSRSFDIDCSGKRALFAPKWTLSLGLQQTIELSGLDVVAAVDSRYRSNRELGFNYLPTGTSGEDLTVDASVNFEFDNGLTVSIFGRNLTNEAVHSTYQIGSANVTARTYEPPRTYGVRVAYDF